MREREQKSLSFLSLGGSMRRESGRKGENRKLKFYEFVLTNVTRKCNRLSRNHLLLFLGKFKY